MSKKDNELMVAALLVGGGLALLALSARKKAELEPPPIGPMALVGNISNLAFANTGMRQPLDKIYGSTILVQAQYVFDITQGGVSVTKSWPVRWEVRLGHSTTVGWKTSGELGFLDSGVRIESVNLDSSPTTRVYPAFSRFSFNTPVDPNQVWDLHAKLYAARPDSLGAPSSEYIQLGSEFKADGAIRSVAQTLLLAGGISSLNFSQIGVGREDILRYLVSSVPRGSNIRNDYPGQSAGFNQSREFIPAFRTAYNPGMGQVGRGSAGMPFRQGFERTDLIRSLQ